MESEFINVNRLPFCKGCGHGLTSKGIGAALARIKALKPLDTIIVTDIGCIGIIDSEFNTHTIHGLHGRSVALGAGISMALENSGKKIIVLLGDGGATIGLQHIFEAAHRNLNMTVIVNNNMLYGMTGGQPSGLTPSGFKTSIMPEGKTSHGYDLVKLVHEVGVPYAQRILASSDFSEDLYEALTTEGFAFVEVLELCPSYGIKLNPGLKLKDIAANSGPVFGKFKNANHGRAQVVRNDKARNLFEDLPRVQDNNKTGVFKGRYAIVICGSAGEGVQNAAEALAMAAISSGLHATKKGSYPVTVGVGFSVSEVVVSSEPILYTGIDYPDAALICSTDGLAKAKGFVGKIKAGWVISDKSLDSIASSSQILLEDLRTPFGPKNAPLLAIVSLLKKSGVVPVETFFDTLKKTSRAKNLEEIIQYCR